MHAELGPLLVFLGSLPGEVPSNSWQMTSVLVMQELVMVAVSPKLELMPTRVEDPPEAVTLSIFT